MVEDIADRLRSAAADTAIPADARVLMAEAAGTIEILRIMVGIREEIEFEDMPAKGRA